MILVPLVRVCDPRFLARMTLSGEVFSATHAAAGGLFDAVVDEAGSLDQWVDSAVASFLKSAPGAVAATKELLAELPGREWQVALEDSAARSVALFAGAEAAEGMAAFLEKQRGLMGPFGPMSTIIASHLDVGGDEFTANAVAMSALVDDVTTLHEGLLEGGGPTYVERHRSRDKMMVRERLEALVDPGTPLLELCPLAGLETDDPLGGGVVVALAEISGTQCLVIANDPTVRGGTTSPTTIKKLLRAMDVAETNRLPLVLLVESGGADLPRQADVFVPGGEQFRRLTQLSAQGIPAICVVFGSSTAGGAYLPGMSDYTIMVDGRARVFLGGPPLVKMAIGEEADEEELGGATMHARVSGLCDYLARDESEALRLARGVVAHLHWPRLGPDPTQSTPDPPLYAPEELLGIASVDVRVPFNMHEIFGAHCGRLTLRGVQSCLRHSTGLWLGHTRWLSHRHRGQQRDPVLTRGPKGCPVHRPVQPNRHAHRLRPEHHRLHGGDPLRTRGHHQKRREADQRRLELDGPAPDPHGRRQL